MPGDHANDSASRPATYILRGAFPTFSPLRRRAPALTSNVGFWRGAADLCIMATGMPIRNFHLWRQSTFLARRHCNEFVKTQAKIAVDDFLCREQEIHCERHGRQPFSRGQARRTLLIKSARPLCNSGATTRFE